MTVRRKYDVPVCSAFRVGNGWLFISEIEIPDHFGLILTFEWTFLDSRLFRIVMQICKEDELKDGPALFGTLQQTQGEGEEHIYICFQGTAEK